jgi:hypothetical protein
MSALIRAAHQLELRSDSSRGVWECPADPYAGGHLDGHDLKGYKSEL